MAVFSAMESYAQFILHRNKIPLDPISLKPGDPHDSKKLASISTRRNVNANSYFA